MMTLVMIVTDQPSRCKRLSCQGATLILPVHKLAKLSYRKSIWYLNLVFPSQIEAILPT